MGFKFLPFIFKQQKLLFLSQHSLVFRGIPGGSAVKNLPASAGATGDTGLIPGSGRSLGGGNGNPLQYCCLGNPMDRGAWQATAHGVTKSWTKLSN